MKIKVLVADDQELTRDCLKIVLGRRDDMEVIDAVGTGTDVIRSVETAAGCDPDGRPHARNGRGHLYEDHQGKLSRDQNHCTHNL